MTAYRYLLADSVTGDVLAELPFSSAYYVNVLNRPGVFSGSMSVEQPRKLSDVLQSSLFPGRSVIHVERDGTLVWSGMFWADQVQQGTYTFTANGWLSYFERRTLTETLTFTETDQAQIGKELIDWAQNVTGGDAKIRTEDATLTGVLRDRTYDSFERNTIAELLVNLSEVIDGFDFRFVPEWFDGKPRVRFLTHYPQTGRDRSLTLDFAGGVSDISLRRDGTLMCTHVEAQGAGEGPGRLFVAASNPELLGSSLRLDAITTHSDVTRTGTLTGYALDRLQLGTSPLAQPHVTLRPDSIAQVGTIAPGDRARVIYSRGFVTSDTTMKVTEQQVNVDAGGNEEMKLSFTNADAWGDL